MIYEKARDASRVWGYWLVQREWRYYDEGGRAFSSVRHAFWTGRLGMPAHGYVKPGHSDDPDVMSVELDRIGACLAAVKRGHYNGLEQSSDLFSGLSAFRNFYQRWLEGHGLISENRLTTEGVAVLRMLAETRASLLGFLDDGVEYVAPPKDVADPAMQAWFRKLAPTIGRESFRFVRSNFGDCVGIELIADAVAEKTSHHTAMDVGRVVWSQTFENADARDRLYRWLCIRMDRWGEWGRVAYRSGPGRLSSHMLRLLVEAPCIEVRTENPQNRLKTG